MKKRNIKITIEDENSISGFSLSDATDPEIISEFIYHIISDSYRNMDHKKIVEQTIEYTELDFEVQRIYNDIMNEISKYPELK